MNRRANVLCVGERSAEMESIAGLIAGERDGVFFVTSELAGLGAIAENRPDIVLVADYLRQGSRESFTRHVADAGDVAPTPVIWLCQSKDADAYTEGAEAGADDVFFGDEADVAILARTSPLIRLSTLYVEMWRRFSVARRFKLEPETVVLPPVENHQPKLLLLEPENVPGLSAEVEVGENVTVCNDPFEAEQVLSSGGYDALMFDATVADTDWIEFIGRIRNHPRLFHLPVIAATDGNREADLALYQAGATQVVFRFGDKAVWRFLSAAQMRHFALRQRLNRSLRQTMHDETVDPLTWTYSPAFLKEHLSSAVGTAKAMRHALSVIRFRVANYAELSEEFEIPSLYHATQQVAQWITHLLRTEDLVARTSDDTFTVVLPNTPLHEAETVRNRIVGVLINTELAVYEVFRPVGVDLVPGVAALTPDDSGETLFERAAPN